MSRCAVQGVVKGIFSRSGLRGPKLGAHLLRHTFATHYIDCGGGVAHLQRILGHKSIDTTMIYVHLSATALRADHAEHSPSPAPPTVTSSLLRVFRFSLSLKGEGAFLENRKPWQSPGEGMHCVA